MKPDDETPREDETPDAGTPEDAGDEHEPSPSTYAGRQRAGDGEEDLGEAEDPGDFDEPGFTDEFDRIERELDAELGDLENEDLDDDEIADADADAEAVEDADAEAAEDDANVDEAADADVDDAGDADEEEEAEEAAEAAPAAGATIEAETVTLADREEAKEAALAGLKARAGDGKAWETSTEHEQVGVAAAAEETEGEEIAPGARPIWARFLTASLVIVVSVAAATSISLLVYLTDIAEGLRDNGKFAEIADQLPEVNGGDPQNILIIGSDERQGVPNDHRSDTTILLRIDPDKQAISLLSIPRDLKVSIPNHGIDKFNAAYSYGGAKLTLRTVQNLTGVDIHHLVNINFTGFADAVNAIDCVYIDVDRRYFIPPESGIAEINLEAGYQRMCGYNALQYVRYRHDDNDLVRSARQQDFLREARGQVPPWKLIEDRNQLIQIFTDYTTSDIDDPVTLLELLKTLLAARNAELHEVHFPATLGTTYVTAGTKEISEAIDAFLGNEGTPGPPETGDADGAEDQGDADKPDGGKGDADKPDLKKPEPEPEGPPMENSSEQGQKYAHQISIKKTKTGEPMVKFPIFYPTQLIPGSLITNDSRAFPIDGPGDDKYWGYKMSIQVEGSAFGNGVPYEYYGISGTNWKDPPIISNPSETREIDGRDYELFWDGDRLRLVAWHDKHDNTYWVNNTLSQSLSGEQMLQIARSMQHDD
jgi:LCP family protein required for cell wall assembly